MYDKNVDSLLKDGAEEIIGELKYGDIGIPFTEIQMLRKYPKLFSTFYHLPSNVEFKVLGTISRLATIVLPVFRFTLSIIEKLCGNILLLFQEYNQQFECNVGENEIVRDFSIIIMERFGYDVRVKNMLIFEHVLYRLGSACENESICIELDLDILKLKAMIKSEEISDIDIEKHKYKLVLQNT